MLAHQASHLDTDDSGRTPKYKRDQVKNFHSIRSTFDQVNFSTRSNAILKTAKFIFCSSPSRRTQSAPPTGTQGEQENTEHGIGLVPPLVGCRGSSGESGSQGISDHHSTTMVRLPGYSSNSGFPCESLSEKVKIKIESGIKAPAKK